MAILMNLSWNQTVIESGNRNWQRKTLDAIFSYKNLRLEMVYSLPGMYIFSTRALSETADGEKIVIWNYNTEVV